MVYIYMRAGEKNRAGVHLISFSPLARSLFSFSFWSVRNLFSRPGERGIYIAGGGAEDGEKEQPLAAAVAGQSINRYGLGSGEYYTAAGVREKEGL